MIGGRANTDHVAEGHGEGEGAGGGCAPSCVECEAKTTSEYNGKLKRGPLTICTCSCCVALSTEKKIFLFRSGGGGGAGAVQGGRSPPCPCTLLYSRLLLEETEIYTLAEAAKIILITVRTKWLPLA